MLAYSLSEAVSDKVLEFVQDNKSFSIHDITLSIRDDVNNNKYSVFDAGSSAEHAVYIDHWDVRYEFLHLLNDGTLHLDREWNSAGYWMYMRITSNPYATTATTNNISSDDEFTRRIKVYLNNCKSRGKNPTLNDIRRGIKRQYSTGLTCGQIKNIVVSLGYRIAHPS